MLPRKPIRTKIKSGGTVVSNAVPKNYPSKMKRR